MQADVYFTEISNQGEKPKYVPRSVQIDLEAGVCNRVRQLSSPYQARLLTIAICRSEVAQPELCFVPILS
jgi:hypothetical protein